MFTNLITAGEAQAWEMLITNVNSIAGDLWTTPDKHRSLEENMTAFVPQWSASLSRSPMRTNIMCDLQLVLNPHALVWSQSRVSLWKETVLSLAFMSAHLHHQSTANLMRSDSHRRPSPFLVSLITLFLSFNTICIDFMFWNLTNFFFLQCFVWKMCFLKCRSLK